MIGPRISFVPYRPRHLVAIDVQDAQSETAVLMLDREYGAQLAVPGLAWSAKVETAQGSRIVGAAGVLPQWSGRAYAWAIFGRVPDPAWLPITRKARQILDQAHGRGIVRIDTTVDAGFKRGRDWMKLLGFRAEALLEAYSPEGRDHIMYARIRRGETRGEEGRRPDRERNRQEAA